MIDKIFTIFYYKSSNKNKDKIKNSLIKKKHLHKYGLLNIFKSYYFLFNRQNFTYILLSFTKFFVNTTSHSLLINIEKVTLKKIEYQTYPIKNCIFITGRVVLWFLKSVK